MANRAKKAQLKLPEKGFTIIELLIATMIFTVILLVLTYGVFAISKAYYKGLNQSDTQNTARTILSDVIQSVEFGGGDSIAQMYGSVANNDLSATPNSDNFGALCIGTQRYSYVLGTELTNANHVLVQDTNSDCETNGTQDLTSPSVVGKELMSPKMRLAVLDLINVAGSNLYKIHIRVVYGNNDVLCNEAAVSGSCNPTAPTMPNPSDYVGGGLTCKDQSGSQFCATSDLYTKLRNYHYWA